MKWLQLISLSTALALGAVACASAGGAGDAQVPPPQQQSPPIAEVSNHNWADMVVYAEAFGKRQRLGVVTSMTTARLQIPPTLAGSGGGIQLVADPIGANERFSTAAIQLLPGQRVELTIENHLAISNYSVRDD